MNILNELLSNKILITGGIAWASAQILKTIIFAIVNRTLDFKRLFGDGGMPSAHSATVTSIAVSFGLYLGFDSPAFTLAAIFALIVMHDAMGVRLETGKQAKVLNDLIKIIYDDTPPDQKLKEFVGHTPSQVVSGFFLGTLVAALVYFYL
ncbi:MAG: divergent PAP2 family protein [Lachnospiraceae bacterium]|nr:divergent PAP2 family protein [Lachnospiraceae bacterium]